MSGQVCAKLKVKSIYSKTINSAIEYSEQHYSFGRNQYFQVSRLVDGIFPVTPNGDTNVNIPTLDSLTSKSAALKLAFRSSTNSSNSNYQPQNILNHPNITTLIPGIGGYQYEVRNT